MVPSGKVRTTKRPAGLTAATLPVVARPGVTIKLGLLLAVGVTEVAVPGGGAATAGRCSRDAQPAKQTAQRTTMTGGLIRDRNKFIRDQTLPIQRRSSQTALSEVKFRRSRMVFAAESSFPFFRLCQASLALMATNCRTLGSR